VFRERGDLIAAAGRIPDKWPEGAAAFRLLNSAHNFEGGFSRGRLKSIMASATFCGGSPRQTLSS